MKNLLEGTGAFHARPSAPFLGALVLVGVFAGFPSSTSAQSDDWETVLAPYVLFGSLNGDAAVGPTGPVPVDLGFGDLVKNLELGAMVHAEAWKGAWGVMVDFLFMRLGSDLTGPFGGVLDINVDEVIAEALLGRRFDAPGRQVHLFAGVRYWDLDVDLDLVALPGAALDLGDRWIDPLVGGRFVKDVAEDWFVSVRGDIGGFGLGSDFSWNVQAGVGYEVSSLFSLVLQYKALDVDFENDGIGTADFLSYDTTTHGPLLGFVFRF